MNRNMYVLLSFCILIFASCQKEQEKISQEETRPHINRQLQNKIEYSSTTSEPKITTDTHNKAKEKRLSESLGVTVDDGKIIIDTKQTKDFFHKISNKMRDGFKKIENSLRHDQIKSTSETGIEISETSIQIDLNKTKTFMEKWTRSMERVVQELNRTMSEIEKSLPQR